MPPADASTESSADAPAEPTIVAAALAATTIVVDTKSVYWDQEDTLKRASTKGGAGETFGTATDPITTGRNKLFRPGPRR